MKENDLIQIVTEFCIGITCLMFVGLVLYGVIAWFWGLL